MKKCQPLQAIKLNFKKSKYNPKSQLSKDGVLPGTAWKSERSLPLILKKVFEEIFLGTSGNKRRARSWWQEGISSSPRSWSDGWKETFVETRIRDSWRRKTQLSNENIWIKNLWTNVLMKLSGSFESPTVSNQTKTEQESNSQTWWWLYDGMEFSWTNSYS